MRVAKEEAVEATGELARQVSIIVCTVDRPLDLERCLESLRIFRAASAEIIVVNNGPHLAVVEAIAQRVDAKEIGRASCRERV